MRERPIFLKRHEVQGVLAGRQAQVRRVAKEFQDRADLDAIIRRFPNQQGCPYGQPGDRLWVREACMVCDIGIEQHVAYRADGEPDESWLRPLRWRPSIHMPRWASRITLEVTGVRVERLQDISDADAKAEGAPMSWASAQYRGGTWRQGFSDLWRQINGPDSWDANPFVWVVSFKRITP